MDTISTLSWENKKKTRNFDLKVSADERKAVIGIKDERCAEKTQVKSKLWKSNEWLGIVLSLVWNWYYLDVELNIELNNDK